MHIRSNPKLPSSIDPHPYRSGERSNLVRNRPFQGPETIVIRLKNRTRLVICLSLIHSSVMLDIDEAEIEPMC